MHSPIALGISGWTPSIFPLLESLFYFLFASITISTPFPMFVEPKISVVITIPFITGTVTKWVNLVDWVIGGIGINVNAPTKSKRILRQVMVH